MLFPVVTPNCDLQLMPVKQKTGASASSQIRVFFSHLSFEERAVKNGINISWKGRRKGSTRSCFS